MKNKFDIMVVNLDKYRLVKSKLIGKCCFNCANCSCRVSAIEYDNDQSFSCIGWENTLLQKKAIALDIYDVSRLSKIPDLTYSVITSTEYEQNKVKILSKNLRVVEKGLI